MPVEIIIQLTCECGALIEEVRGDVGMTQLWDKVKSGHRKSTVNGVLAYRCSSCEPPNRLKEAQRAREDRIPQVVQMVVVEGRTYTEVAKLFGVHPCTIKSDLREFERRQRRKRGNTSP